MDIKPRKFEWESPEGDGDEVYKQDNLTRYIASHIPLIDKYRMRIRLSDKASMRWASANRSGGSRPRASKALNAAIEAELLRRERQVEPVEQGSAQAHVEVRYQLQYAVDNQRIECNMLADEFNIKKLTLKDKLKAAITSAYASNDLDAAKRAQDHLEEKLTLDRIKQRAKKSRKQMIKQCVSKWIEIQTLQIRIRTMII